MFHECSVLCRLEHSRKLKRRPSQKHRRKLCHLLPLLLSFSVTRGSKKVLLLCRSERFGSLGVLLQQLPSGFGIFSQE